MSIQALHRKKVTGIWPVQYNAINGINNLAKIVTLPQNLWSRARIETTVLKKGTHPKDHHVIEEATDLSFLFNNDLVETEEPG